MWVIAHGTCSGDGCVRLSFWSQKYAAPQEKYLLPQPIWTLMGFPLTCVQAKQQGKPPQTPNSLPAKSNTTPLGRPPTAASGKSAAAAAPTKGAPATAALSASAAPRRSPAPAPSEALAASGHATAADAPGGVEAVGETGKGNAGGNFSVIGLDPDGAEPEGQALEPGSAVGGDAEDQAATRTMAAASGAAREPFPGCKEHPEQLGRVQEEHGGDSHAPHDAAGDARPGGVGAGAAPAGRGVGAGRESRGETGGGGGRVREARAPREGDIADSALEPQGSSRSKPTHMPAAAYAAALAAAAAEAGAGLGTMGATALQAGPRAASSPADGCGRVGPGLDGEGERCPEQGGSEWDEDDAAAAEALAAHLGQQGPQLESVGELGWPQAPALCSSEAKEVAEGAGTQARGGPKLLQGDGVSEGAVGREASITAASTGEVAYAVRVGACMAHTSYLRNNPHYMDGEVTRKMTYWHGCHFTRWRPARHDDNRHWLPLPSDTASCSIRLTPRSA